VVRLEEKWHCYRRGSTVRGGVVRLEEGVARL
jgi:hypothetical protein